MWRLSVVLFLLGASPILANERKTLRDVAYTEAADKQRRLDVYAPPEGKDLPVAVWIHGGGWRRGDKAGVQQKPAAFVKNGYVFVSVNYRFVPSVTVKEMATDIAKAIAWVRENAKAHGGSGEKIVVLGHSAGAHLAALVCTDDRYLKAEGMSLADVKACVPVDTAAYDVSEQVKSVGPLRRRTYTSVFGDDEEKQKEVSPMTYISKRKGIPPFLILHVADRADSRRQSKALAAALKTAGVKVQVVAAGGKNHGTINRDLGQPDDKSTRAIFEFLKARVSSKFND